MLFALREWERHVDEGRLVTVTTRPPDAVYYKRFKDEEAANKYARNQQIGGCYWQVLPASVQEGLSEQYKGEVIIGR